MALGRRTPPGEAKHDTWIMAQLFLRLKALYQKEGGGFPDPIVNLTGTTRIPESRHRKSSRKEING